MAKTQDIRARIEADLKAEGEEILKTLGMNTSDALTLFWRQMVLQKGLPFDVKIPNAETIAALNEPRGQGKRYKNAREMHADILAEADEA